MGFAIVTGASRGIGRVLAQRLAAEGHKVAALARSKDALDELASELILSVPVDLADAQALDDTVTRLLGEHGPCDLLVNNAGYAIRSAVEDIPMSDWRHEFEVNLFAATRLIQLVLPGMRELGRGRIVNISSVAGRISPPFSGAYAATKFAMEAMSDALRIEVAPFGIQVVLVEPGPVSTEFAAVAKQGSTEILENPDTVYARGYEAFLEQVGTMRKTAWTAEQVADKTMWAIRTSNPPLRVACYNATLRAGLVLRATAPGLLDRILGRRTRT